MNDHIDGLAEDKQDEKDYDDRHRAPEKNEPDEPEEPAESKPFDEQYIKELRAENKRYRQRAKEADELAARVHTLLVEKDGRLQDATDLPFNPEHLDNPDALDEAITDLLARKPHLKARRATGDIGAGNRGAAEEDSPFDLITHIRNI